MKKMVIAAALGALLLAAGAASAQTSSATSSQSSPSPAPSSAASTAPAGQPTPQQVDRDLQVMQAAVLERLIQNRGALLDARLGALHGVLRLTSDQEKQWGPFESAVRSSLQQAQDAMMKAIEARKAATTPPSTIARMNALADHLSQESSRIKAVAAGAQPLYDSLNDEQKRRFDLLSRLIMRAQARNPGVDLSAEQDRGAASASGGQSGGSSSGASSSEPAASSDDD